MQTCLSLQGGLCCAENCLSHSAGAALDILVSPYMTPEKWSVTSTQVVSLSIPSKSTRRSLFLDVSPANKKLMDDP